jgi:hypothetical protein
MNNHTRTLDDVAGSIRNADGQCVVLIGDGCSLSAGIPLADTLVAEINKHHPEAYNRAFLEAGSKLPSYNAVMEELSPNERQKLLNQYIEKAKVNWAHLALAQLFANKKINRVLTVNFDPLLVKACSMVDFYPAIYDLAGTDSFKSHRIAPQSVFYLNGQHTGFVTLNATDELEAHRKRLSTVVEDTGVRRVWIVVGYSGEADPLLDILAIKDSFDGDLYWLGYSEEPKPHLINSGLLSKQKRAFYVGGQDADICLTELAQKLECFPPDILIKPFDHLQRVVSNIDFDTGGDVAKALKERLFNDLTKAANAENSTEKNVVSDARRWMLNGEYEKVIQLYENNLSDAYSADLKAFASWAYVKQGISLGREAEKVAENDLKAAQVLWAQARDTFTIAFNLKVDEYYAAFNWGIAFAKEAREVAKTDIKAAHALWRAAIDKYGIALSLKTDYHLAADSKGTALIVLHNTELATDRQNAMISLVQAQTLLEQHSLMDEDGRFTVSFNLACVYGLQGRAADAVAQLEICRVAGKLPGHWRRDTDLDPIRSSDEYKTWYKTHFGFDKA